MSNNREVEVDGDVWFFSAADSQKIRDIEANPVVHLSYVDLEAWRFLSVTGKARIVHTVKKKQELWQPELERWFDDGPESDAIVLIKVAPTLVSYWTKKDDGQVGIR
jgi:general stress protein 26